MEEKFESKILEIKRVSHTRAGGKKIRFRVAIVVGNKKGKVGFGVDSASDLAFAIEKATKEAIKNIIEVPIVKDTIPHEVFGKFSASKVLLKPQAKGRGIVAGGPVRVICKLAGIKNISAKILGMSSNKMNNARATILAFKKLKKTKNAT